MLLKSMFSMPEAADDAEPEPPTTSVACMPSCPRSRRKRCSSPAFRPFSSTFAVSPGCRSFVWTLVSCTLKLCTADPAFVTRMPLSGRTDLPVVGVRRDNDREEANISATSANAIPAVPTASRSRRVNNGTRISLRSVSNGGDGLVSRR